MIFLSCWVVRIRPEPVPQRIILLRLSGSVESVFLERMKDSFPERIGKITSRLREVRGGARTEGEFSRRHTRKGICWEIIEQLFGLVKQ